METVYSESGRGGENVLPTVVVPSDPLFCYIHHCQIYMFTDSQIILIEGTSKH